MNREIYAYHVKHESDPHRFLDVNNAGISYASDADMTSERKNGRNDYQFLYVRRGTVRVLEHGKNVRVCAPAYILYRPFEPLLYTFCKGSEVYWVHFSGKCAEEILKDSHAEYFFGVAADREEIPPLWHRMIRTLKTEPLQGKTLCAGYFLEILALASACESFAAEGENQYYEKIKPALTEMTVGYAPKKTVEEYARMCFLSKYTFIKLFKKATGLPPIAFINSKRLEDSLYLLLETDYKIEEIADSVGYENPLYFSRLFREKYGVSPSRYRKEKK